MQPYGDPHNGQSEDAAAARDEPDSSQRPEEQLGVVLVVEDELIVQLEITRVLRNAGFAVEGAGSVAEALALMETTAFDIMVLDLNLPDTPGTSLLKHAHQSFPRLLVVILTAYPTIENAIAAIRSGAVDYLLKPVTGRDIVRVATRLWRQRQRELYRDQLIRTISKAADALQQDAILRAPAPNLEISCDQTLHVHPLTLDCQRRLAMIETRDDETRVASLSEGETVVLTVLMSRPGQVLSCRQLVQRAWGDEVDEATARNVIRPIISRIRGKIEANPQEPRLIRTVRGRGYFFHSR